MVPNSVTYIGDYAFDDCSKLTYNEKDNLKYLGNSENLYLYLAGTTNTSITEANIDNNCRLIGACAFAHCSGLKSITIPNSVTSIGNEAFYYCSGLTSVTIPNSVTSIGGGAFSECGNLTSVEIPNSVTYIGDYVFNYCSKLTYNEKDNLKYLGNSENLYLYLEDTTNTDIVEAKIDTNCKFIGDYAFIYCSRLTSVTIPNSVTSIGGGAFQGCNKLTYNIKDNLKYLGNSENLYLYLEDTTNTDIVEAKIDTNCKFIGDYAFIYCSRLTSVTIPNSVTSIGAFAFSSCSGLISVTIPNSVTSIGGSAFDDCSRLTKINFEGTISQWKDITKGVSWANGVPSSCKIYCTDGTISI